MVKNKSNLSIGTEIKCIDNMMKTRVKLDDAELW